MGHWLDSVYLDLEKWWAQKPPMVKIFYVKNRVNLYVNFCVTFS